MPEKLATLVHYLRHEKVILDSDPAELYGVTTGRLNEAVQRNLERFPADFMFCLSESLLSQIAIAKNAGSSKRGGRRTLPYAFTEQGVAMLSSVLRSPRAVEVNIAIMRTFVLLRRLMDSNALLAEKIEALEEKYADHDQQFQLVFEAIKQLIASRACPGIAKRRRASSERARLPHHPLRTIHQKTTQTPQIHGSIDDSRFFDCGFRICRSDTSPIPKPTKNPRVPVP